VACSLVVDACYLPSLSRSPRPLAPPLPLDASIG
jgi:hypothetical protein